jgi:hypothetical protein
LFAFFLNFSTFLNEYILILVGPDEILKTQYGTVQQMIQEIQNVWLGRKTRAWATWSKVGTPLKHCQLARRKETTHDQPTTCQRKRNHPRSPYDTMDKPKTTHDLHSREEWGGLPAILDQFSFRGSKIIVNNMVFLNHCTIIIINILGHTP